MSASVQSKMIRGAGWMLLFQLLDRVLGLTSMLLLVHLLSPADFGIIAMAISFIAMGELLSMFRFDLALIQHQNVTDEHYYSAWTCNVLLGCAITALLLALAWPAAQFYHQPEVFEVLCALAFGPLLASVENIGVVRFRVHLQFRKEFFFRTSRRLISFVVALPLAFMLRDYWALVAAILVTKLGSSLLSYLAHDFRPRLCLTKASELFGFSKWMLFNNTIAFFKEHATDFVIGRFHGPAALGLYDISHEISSLPTADLSAPINRALIPGYARLGAGDELRSAYATAMSSLTLIALPAAAGIFAVAPFLVPVALGNAWLGATPLLEILAFNGAVVLFHSSIGAALIAKGYPRDVARVNTYYVLLLLTLLAVLAPNYGTVGVAYAVVGAAVVMTPAFLSIIKRRLGVDVGIFARAVVRPLLASVLMLLVVRGVLPAYESSMSLERAAALLAGGVALGVVVYAGTIGLLWVMMGRPVGVEHKLFQHIRGQSAQRAADSPVAAVDRH
jgi:O-antigen/teichoic acid export membrane protein